MTKSKESSMAKKDVSLMDAIFNRQSIRDFEDKTVDTEIIDALIEAAVRAPTAMYEEPWAFAVVKDKAFLNKISEMSKVLLREEAKKNPDSEQAQADLAVLEQPNFNIFFNAQHMVVIYSKFPGDFVATDCWLAAENLMLAAYAHGLGSCSIALALNPLNTAEIKKELGIPEGMIAIAPIIIGWPSTVSSQSSRQPPEVYYYK
jgi:nitroreductase